MDNFIKIEIEGKEYKFPVITGSEGEKGFDISRFGKSLL